MSDFSVVIVGGGVAGLTCANYLHNKNINFLLLEATNEVGGRVKTDVVDGYLLDHGFQVLQTNYSEAKQLLNYDALNLQLFESGAKIRATDGFMSMQNPFRNPLAFLPLAFSSVGSLVDKLKVARLIGQIKLVSDEKLLAQRSVSTNDFLKTYGFSDKIINNFFRPFFGGVFLEEELATASNFFKFTFKQFFAGDAALPERGMQQIPLQLRSNLPENSVRVNSPVELIENNQVKLADGTTITADKIVIATNPTVTDRLLSREYIDRKFNTTTCLYFSADFSPLAGKKYLTLNPNRRQLVHHMCVPSDVSSAYAPVGKTVISVTLRASELSKTKQVEQAKRELSEWFGSSVNAWRLLGEYKIPQAVSFYDGNTQPIEYQIDENLYVCGDYLAYPSLNGAMKTGREVAELLY